MVHYCNSVYGASNSPTLSEVKKTLSGVNRLQFPYEPAKGYPVKNRLK